MNEEFLRQILRKKPTFVIGNSSDLYIDHWQFQSAFTREDDSDPPSKGASPFSSMGDITVDPKGVAKLLDGLNVHKASGTDELNARVLKECSNEISPILALIYNESLARARYQMSGDKHMFLRSLKRVKNMMLLTTCRCRSHASAANPRAYFIQQHQQALSLR